MAGVVEASQVTRKEPSIDDGFRRELWIIEIVRHDSLAFYCHFANTVRIRIQNAQLHTWKRPAYGVGTKGLEIIQGHSCSRFGKPVAVRDRDSEIIEKLQRGRLHERATGEKGEQLTAECFVDLSEQRAAEPDIRTTTCEQLVQSDH